MRKFAKIHDFAHGSTVVDRATEDFVLDQKFAKGKPTQRGALAGPRRPAGVITKGKTRQGKTRQAKAQKTRQGKIWQGKTRQGKTSRTEGKTRRNIDPGVRSPPFRGLPCPMSAGPLVPASLRPARTSAALSRQGLTWRTPSSPASTAARRTSSGPTSATRAWAAPTSGSATCRLALSACCRT